MGVEVHHPALPGSKEWKTLITSSKISAIMGDSRWDTKWSLYQMMTGAVDAEPQKDIFKVGHAAELMLAELWRLENEGWKLSSGEVQYTDNELPFPNAATLDRRASRGRARKYVEFKTARRLEDWGDLDGTKLPRDYHRQTIWGQGISGFTKEPAELMVMGPFFKHFTYQIEFDQDVFDDMCHQAEQFYKDFLNGVEPPCEGKPCDYRVVREMHPDITKDADEQVSEFLYDMWASKSSELGKLTAEVNSLKTKLMAQMGKAEYGSTDGETVLRRVRSGRGISLKNIREESK